MLPKIAKPQKIIYLDHAATTPLDKEVKKAMEPFLTGKFGNPSSLYQKGREAKLAVEQSRKTIAGIIGARPEEIIFTAGGTESVNLAIFGVARNSRSGGKKSPHLITTAVEHHAVLNSFEALEGEGYRTSLVGVDAQGFIKFDELKAAVKSETIFLSVMLANNEIGTIEPVAEIGKWLKGLNRERRQKGRPEIIFHTDACQAAGALDLDVNRLGVDLMTVNGSKIYGPKQTGFLFVRSGVKIKPLVYGGGQEWGLRSGTENVAGIVGLAKALEMVQKHHVAESKRLRGLRDYFIAKAKSSVSGILLNGLDPIKIKADKNPHQLILNDRRLPNNINLTFKGVEGEALMFYMDAYGVCVSTASACSTGTTEPSHVLLAIGRGQREAKSSIRLTLGKTTTKKDLDYLLKILPSIVKELRKVKSLN